MPRRRSGWRTAFLVASGLLALTVAAGSGLALTTIRDLEEVIPRLPVGQSCTGPSCLQDVEPECLSRACTYLILGSDTRRGLTEEEQGRFGSEETVGGERADTIILVQVDIPNDRTVVLSIPRDLRVNIPGYGVGKINTAITHPEGANLMVKTIKQLTGLRINHYVQINLAGFRKAVDALGGVPICVNRPMFDQKAGLNLPRAGCYLLDGAEALAFVRARNVEGDLIPDFSRISRQQQFMRAVIHKALSISSVFRLPALVRAVGNNLVLSNNLNLYDVQDLTHELGDLGQKGVMFRVVPSVPVTIDGVSYVDLVEYDAAELFRRMREGEPLDRYGVALQGTPISPANVRVRVLDAGSGGMADDVAAFLRQAGFVVVGPEVAPARYAESIVFGKRTTTAEREVVSAYLPGVPIEFNRRVSRDVDVAVIVGADFPQIDGLAAGA